VTGPTQWHFLTAEYPPDPGGVADYTHLLATALAASSQAVHVWVPSTRPDTQREGGVVIHPLPGLGPGGLKKLEQGLRKLPGPRRLFVQYVPTALGLRGMNVPLIRWLSETHDEVWVQFHEVALGWKWRRKPHLHLTHAVQLWMASALARRADRIFISVEGWRRLLGADGPRATWLPIPSNIPTALSDLAIEAAKRELGPGLWLGHFGTYGSLITRDLMPALSTIAARNGELRILLLGRGAVQFAKRLGLGARVRADEGLPGEAVAARLAACDLLLQPFPDGISARRTSAMAGLALGVPLVSTDGHLTDSIWRSGDAVALAPAGRPEELAELCLDLLGKPGRRRELGERGAALYAERFSMERTCAILQARPGDHGCRAS
jgi:glycosyltransferase involved in cell wall biosynthesis